MCSGKDGSLFQVPRETETATKTSLRCYKFYRTFFILFSSLNVSQRFWTWILKDCIELEEKKKRVVVLCSRPLLNVKIIRQFHVVVVQRRQRNVYKEAWCSCKVVLWRSRCRCRCRCRCRPRRRRRCFSSLITCRDRANCCPKTHGG